MATHPFDSAKHLADIAALYRADEAACIETLLPAAGLSPVERDRAATRAGMWVEEIRRTHKPSASVSDLLSQFGLTSHEGLALMCLAEALLRIPDRATADALIRDKLSEAHWNEALGADAPWAINATGWALALTGKIINMNKPLEDTPGAAIGTLVSRLGQPVIREAIRGAMQWMADQFVTGETIEDALKRSQPHMTKGVRYSFDMLGEGARTADDAERYFKVYLDAIEAVGRFQAQHKFTRASGISVKLSALHPRYEIAHIGVVMDEMLPRLITLCERAAAHNIPVTIDAEESERLQLSLEVACELMARANLGTWDGLGFAVQAYQKRASLVIDYLVALGRHHSRRIHVRLVKGAYWDSEVKRTQERGLADFPVYTRKPSTDVSYLACARRMLAAAEWINPVFGTHNAMTVAHIAEVARGTGHLEFQRLHGMAEELHGLMQKDGFGCCVYAPVGNHDVLLGYLVRRILENGANSSFVHRLLDPSVSVNELIADPVEQTRNTIPLRHPAIRRAQDLFAPERENSAGVDLSDPFITKGLLDGIAQAPFVDVPALSVSPDVAFQKATSSYPIWSRTDVSRRAGVLEKLAELLEENRVSLMALLVHEAGKTIGDALGEVREAVDFCRYYANRARVDFLPTELPGPTGERNTLQLVGRGVFLCISPWNFPLAIFLGQVTAALVAGNCVIAKPAPQTPRIAAFTTKLIHDAGIPYNVFHLCPGGVDVGAALVAHQDVAGVAFTGSTATARNINRALAAKDTPIVPLIAETGGQNALIVDSSALPEQVVDDVITSAFRSAGQRCSALRVLCLPESTADKILEMLKGSMAQLRIGDPAKLETDVGPVIDKAAQERLIMHGEKLHLDAKEVYSCILPPLAGTYVAPQAWEIPSLSWLTGEVFGPILHVVRYKPEGLSALIAQINTTGFGLTGGIHSRLESTIAQVSRDLHVGNLYVNRSLIGAIVGSQPFGGQGLSGTGPKAGGPHYLARFAHEVVISNNTTAAGGNASLLAVSG